MKNNYDLGYYFKNISKMYESAREHDMKKFNLTSQQINIIFYLKSHINEETNQKKIEEHFELSNATVSGILKRMEIKGLIKRVSSKKDKRDKIIMFTEEGNAIKDEIMKEVIAHEQKMTKNFTLEEKEMLISLLNRINENFKEGKND